VNQSARLILLAQLIFERPRSLDFLADHFGLSTRTIRRDLKVLEEELFMPVDVDYNQKWFIVNGDKTYVFEYLAGNRWRF
jgi:transcriptional antiterminator